MSINIYPTKRITSRKIRLKQVRVRLISEQEKDRWNDVVSQFHHLGNANLPGRQLRYVAETPHGRCLALISFGAPALQLQGRDAWIGWHPEQRLQRLHFIVQNSRFLILPWIQTKNLASRVMALCLDRLEQDWQEAFGYSPVLVETFVDRCRKGTSYRADNWIRLGETAGFSRDKQGFYRHNGSPKTLWVKPLRTDAAEILRSDTLPEDLADYELPPNPERVARNVKSVSLETLIDAFHSLTDSRAKKGRRHSLSTCLAVVACGILAGARGLSECATVGESLREPQRRALRMWRPRGQKKRVAPSHATLWRALSSVDPVEFERVILQWYNSQSDQLPAAIALDGKAVRSTLDEDNCGLHVVSAVPHDDTFFFSQTTIQCKGNEHEAVRNLIAANPKLTGTVFTLDAIHCNSESCREICEDAHAHYIMGVKENQGKLLQDIESMFTASKPADSINLEEKGHGREERRTVELMPVESRPNLPYARTAVRVHRTRRPVRKGKRGKKGQETAYFLTSLSLHKDELSAEKAAGLIRGHWDAIENGLHHVKDATLLEDRYRANNGLARIMAAMRSLAVLIFRPLKYTTKNAMRKMAGNLHHAVRFLRARSLSKARTGFLN